jgi:hypothetical protein
VSAGCITWGYDMQIFSRQIRLVGGGEAAAWAVATTEKAREVSGLPISLWASVVGLPSGSYAWSSPVDGMGQLAEATDKMAADGDLAALVLQGRDYVADVLPDRLHALIHGEVTEPAAVGTYMLNVNAVAAQGQGQAAGAWAVKIADIWGGITGLSPVVTTTVSGPMFEYSWFARHATATSIDESMAKLMASADYAAEVDSAGGLFHPGAAQVYARRIA